LGDKSSNLIPTLRVGCHSLLRTCFGITLVSNFRLTVKVWRRIRNGERNCLPPPRGRRQAD
jgi:hypothetical protein